MSEPRETHVEVASTVTKAARLTAQGEAMLAALTNLIATIESLESAAPWGTNEQYVKPFRDAYFGDSDGAEAVRRAARGVARQIIACGTKVGVGAMTIEDADAEGSRTVGGVM